MVKSTTSNPRKFNAPLCHFVVLMSSWLCAKLNIVISASENYPHLGCLFFVMILITLLLSKYSIGRYLEYLVFRGVGWFLKLLVT